ncbi:MAG: cysteine desulfurase family protein [Candidatus Onthomonas sp.]
MDETRRVIYADHAATTPLEPRVLAAMEPYLKEQFANPSGLYRFGLKSRQGVERARQQMAADLDCSPGELYFTSGGSEGNSWAVWSGALGESAGARLLVTTPIEHHSVLRACQGMKALGMGTEYLPVESSGAVPEQALAEMLERRPRLVSLQYANNETGVIQDIPKLGRMCRRAGVLIHSDAVQAVGHIPVDLSAVDLLTASAHKFGGPKGIGFLYARRGVRLRPLIYGGEQESGLRGGTEQVAAIVGMAEALHLSLERMETQHQRQRQMAEEFCWVLAGGCPGVRFHSTPAGLPGLVSAVLPGVSAQQLVYRMDLADVLISPGAACDNRGEKKPSHVLTAIGDSPEDALSTIRVTFGSANQDGDGGEAARRLLAVLRQIAPENS